jgi:hypothetical protein
MKKFAQFFHKSAISNQLIPACGNDSVYDIDRRLSNRNAISLAYRICKEKGYLGFTLNQGERYYNSREIRPLEII